MTLTEQVAKNDQQDFLSYYKIVDSTLGTKYKN